jgi:hypothetical protein
MEGFSVASLRDKLAEIESELIDRGVFRPGVDGDPDLDDGAADLLSVCFDADQAITAEVSGSVLSTVYLRDERTVAVSAVDDEVLLAELSPDEGPSGWFLDALGEGDDWADASAHRVGMTIEQLDELLRAATEGGPDEVERVSASYDWDADLLMPVMAGLAGSADAISMTAVRPGDPQIVVSRLRPTCGGAWVLRIFAQGVQDRAEVAWHPTTALLAVIRDVDEP